MPLNRLEDGTYVFDYSTLSTFALCKRKGRNRFVLDLEAKRPSVKLGFGQAYHSALAVHYSGGSWDDMIRAATAKAQEYDIPLSIDEDAGKSLEALVNSLRRYVQFYADEPYRVVKDANGKPMVELVHRMVLSKDPPILYAMKIDAIVEHIFHGTIHPMDHKTTGRIHDFMVTIRPNHQFTGYLGYVRELFGSRATSAIMNAIYAVGELKTKKRKLNEWFGRAETGASEYDFEDWHKSMLFYAKEFIQLAESDGYFPMNAPFACHVYDGCLYRDLCSQHDDPVVRDGHYNKSPWGLLGDE